MEQTNSAERNTNDLNDEENELRDSQQYHTIQDRVMNLELMQKNSELSMFNLSQQLSSYDKLHISMLELLENVENIESKVDKSIPDFRKEISKLEFQMAETVSKVASLKEDQTNTRQSVKAISVSVSNLKDKFEIEENAMEELNATVEHLKESTSVQNSKLHDHILKVSIHTILD